MRDVIGLEKFSSWEELSKHQQSQSMLFGQAMNYLFTNRELSTENFNMKQILNEADRLMQNNLFNQLVLECAVHQVHIGYIYYGEKNYIESLEPQNIIKMIYRYTDKMPMVDLRYFYRHIKDAEENDKLKF